MGRKVKTINLTVDIDDITKQDMPNEMFEEIFDMCGKEVAVSLLENQCGVMIAVPARPFIKLERRLMIDEFDGTTASIRKIARKYQITEAVVRDELKRNRKNVPVEGQLDMFAEEYE